MPVGQCTERVFPEAIGEGVRVYRAREVPGMMDGRAALLTQRLVKRLENVTGRATSKSSATATRIRDRAAD